MSTSTRWYPLRRRLLLLLLGGLAACWLATVGWGYADAHREIDELFDAQLAQAARTLLARDGRHREHVGVEELERATHPYQQALLYQVWHDDGSLALRSPTAPTTPLTDVDGFSETVGPDGHWRFYSQWDQQRRHRVQVAENHAGRDRLIGHIAWRLALPALVALPLLGVWLWFATRRSLAPLDAVAAQIDRQAPDRLHTVAPATAPSEIRSLLDALNDLLRRVGQAMESERRFTADAAHELRTPLAALAAQAQVAERARDEDERRRALAQLRAGCARATHLVEQLLTLARLDPEQAASASAPVALDLVAAEVCAAHGGDALAKRIELEFAGAPASIAGDAGLIGILLRNLVDNAIRYTPPGGHVTVALTGTGDTVELTVADSGPGIPPAERAAALRPFHRLAGQDSAGSGLGLSIVARIAELHRATLTLADGTDGRGLAVVVRLPKA